MKKILLAFLIILFASPSAHAISCAAGLQPLFNSYQATKLCATFPVSSTMAASLLPDDDNTLDLGASSYNWRSIYVGTSVIGESDLTLTAAVDDVIITATDDVTIQGQGSGDVITLAGGGTAVDVTVADDLVTLASGTALTLTSGTLTVTAGDLVMTSGDITMTSGALNIAAAANLGLIAENGANTACDTTCTAGCVAGYDAGTSAFVACNSALADSCLCAGAAS